MERLKADHTAVEASLIASQMEEAMRKEREAIEVIKINNEYFYCYARNKSRIEPGIGPFKLDGEIFTCATQYPMRCENNSGAFSVSQSSVPHKKISTLNRNS